MTDRQADSRRHSPQQNRILAALPAADFERLHPSLRLTALRPGDVLHESGAQVRDVYFPVSGLVSRVYTLENGATAGTAVVGNDGCVGIGILLGGGATPSRIVVQIAGYAYRVSAEAILAEFHKGGAVRRMLLRYIEALMLQTSQTAVCNRHHTVEQRLCRWLLMSLDRLPSGRVDMTQGPISRMLGVRRVSITEAARRLQALGLIRYARGHVTVPDRAKLQAHACECYAVVKRETDRLQSS